jgi:hypothetical protein
MGPCIGDENQQQERQPFPLYHVAIVVGLISRVKYPASQRRPGQASLGGSLPVANAKRRQAVTNRSKPQRLVCHFVFSSAYKIVIADCRTANLAVIGIY